MLEVAVLVALLDSIAETSRARQRNISRKLPGKFMDMFRQILGNFPEMSWTCPGHVRDIYGKCVEICRGKNAGHVQEIYIACSKASTGTMNLLLGSSSSVLRRIEYVNMLLSGFTPLFLGLAPVQHFRIINGTISETLQNTSRNYPEIIHTHTNPDHSKMQKKSRNYQ